MTFSANWHHTVEYVFINALCAVRFAESALSMLVVAVVAVLVVLLPPDGTATFTDVVFLASQSNIRHLPLNIGLPSMMRRLFFSAAVSLYLPSEQRLASSCLCLSLHLPALPSFPPP